MPHTISAGQLFSPGITAWPEGAHYSYSRDGHRLVILMRRPSDAEIDAVRAGDSELGLITYESVITLWYRLGERVLDGDAPYSWHLEREADRQMPPDLTGDERATISVVLVDASNGIVRAIRLASMSPAFSQALHAAIRRQAESPWDQQAYDRSLQTLYRLATDSRQLARRAKIRTPLGA